MARASGYYGLAFKASRGVTRGDIVSPMLFNIVLDCIIKNWRFYCADTAVAVGAIFYADDSELSSTDPGKLQLAIDQFTDYFKRVGLRMNAVKTKDIIADPGKVQLGLSSSPAYRFRVTGIGISE